MPISCRIWGIDLICTDEALAICDENDGDISIGITSLAVPTTP